MPLIEMPYTPSEDEQKLIDHLVGRLRDLQEAYQREAQPIIDKIAEIRALRQAQVFFVPDEDEQAEIAKRFPWIAEKALEG